MNESSKRWLAFAQEDLQVAEEVVSIPFLQIDDANPFFISS